MKYAYICMSLFIMLGSFAHAQIPGSDGSFDINSLLNSLGGGSLDAITGEQISLTLDPQFPAPGDVFIARLDDYSITNFGASIVWSLNGTELTEFRNNRSISLRAGAVGVADTLTVTLFGQDGQTYSAAQTITPRYLDIIIEPLTYAPATYAGRPLPIFGSQVLLTALLHDRNGLVDASQYTYTWQVENRFIDQGPVRGKFKSFITIPHGRNIIVTVEIKDIRGTSVARRVFTIPSVEIDTHFYEVNPLFGMSNKAIQDGYLLLSNSSTIYAIPYNLDLTARPETQNIEWAINSQRVNPGANPYQLTVASAAGTSARVQFKIRNVVELLQGDSKTVQVSF